MRRGADQTVESRVPYVIVGVFVVVALTALAGLGLWLGTDVDTRRYLPYRVLTTESVTGINRGGFVRYRGVVVGRVKGVTLVDSERVAIDHGVYGVPETFLIDAEGIIRYRHIGPIDEKAWREVLQPKWAALGGGKR